MKRFKGITDGRSGSASIVLPFNKQVYREICPPVMPLNQTSVSAEFFSKNEAEIDKRGEVVTRPPHGTRVFQSPTGFFG